MVESRFMDYISEGRKRMMRTLIKNLLVMTGLLVVLGQPVQAEVRWIQVDVEGMA